MADFWSVIDAIGSFGGMVLAGIAGYVAYRLFKVESERDRKVELLQARQAEESMRQQAASVGFWLDPSGSAHIFNASPLPIYDVNLRGTAVHGDSGQMSWRSA